MRQRFNFMYNFTALIFLKMDLYIFARALFNKKLRAAGLNNENPTLWDAQHPDEVEVSEQTMQDKAVAEMANISKDDLQGEHILVPAKPFRRR